ncbi:MAG: tol-pal system-associated acyl-CoA thioesterase [Gammaproteobacteria bacterium]|nr:tol-pal system-associated acyl-CoA thioesterase [Gammaproteobacteria bacterium]
MPVHSLPCRVYFEDTDAGGVVYYANYLKFYERARTEFLRELGFEQDVLLQQNIVFVVRQVTVDYIQSAAFNAMLRVDTTIEQLKKASLVFQQQIVKLDSERETLVNKALVKVACVSADGFKPTAIPKDIYTKLG